MFAICHECHYCKYNQRVLSFKTSRDVKWAARGNGAELYMRAL